MAEIVELQAYDKKRRRRRACPGGGIADVVMFPGVRIDRKNISLAERLLPGKRTASSSRARNKPAKCDD